MQYFDVYAGGPSDGACEKSLFGERVRKLTLRAHVDRGLDRWGIYEYERSETEGEVTKRHYRYVRTELREEAERFVNEQGGFA